MLENCEFLKWFLDWVLMPLDCDVRLNIFIGVTGVLVAIVIFVAELINGKKRETEKNFILFKTDIKKKTIFVIATLFIMLVSLVIPFKDIYSSNFFVTLLYILVQLIINFMIVKSIFYTIDIFVIAIKLNSSSKYYFYEFDNYIYYLLNDLDIKNMKRRSEVEKTSAFKELIIGEDDNFFSYDCSSLEGYAPIRAEKIGTFLSYGNSIKENLKSKLLENTDLENIKEYKINSKPIFLFPLKPWERVNSSTIIAYCLCDTKKYENIIREGIKYFNTYPYELDSISILLDDLFDIEMKRSIPSDVSMYQRIRKYFEYLYDKKMDWILDISFEHIEKEYIKRSSNYKSNKELCRIVNILSFVSYNNNDFIHYKQMTNYLFYLYNRQLSLINDIKQVSYDFSTRVIRYDIYSVKKNEDNRYYEQLLSVVFKFVIELLAMKKYESISVIFDNVMFDNVSYFDNDNFELSDVDISKLQFSYGIIYCLIMMAIKKRITKDDKDGIKKILKLIKSHFVLTFEQWNAILLFKKYYNYDSAIQNVYSDLNFYFEEKKYKSHWSALHVSDFEIIKEFIYLFNINISDIDSVLSSDVKRGDEYYFKSVLEVIDKKQSSLDDILDINFNVNSIKEILGKAKNLSENKTREYNRENKLDYKLVDDFKNTLLNKIKSGNKLFLYLNQIGKVISNNTKKGKSVGVNHLLDREFFFDYDFGIKTMAVNVGHTIVFDVFKEYVNKIDSISKISNINIYDKLSTIDDLENYIIFASNSFCYKINGYNNEKIVLNDKSIDVILTNKSDFAYLIAKKDLPNVEMRAFEDELLNDTNYTLDSGIYYSFEDCASDNELCKKIASDSEWISEQNPNIDPINYVREKCLIKVLISYVIKNANNEDIICYKFDRKDTINN